MKLERLYIEPNSPFEPVVFKDGANFVLARKTDSIAGKSPLNGLGKSLFLNLIDYCLLSSETAHIKSAKDNNKELVGKFAVLEFSIDGCVYIIKRPFSKPNEGLLFGKKGHELSQFDIGKEDKYLSQLLCNLIYQASSKEGGYVGVFEDTWLRQLTPFFIKNQTSKTKVNFSDPIKFISGASDAKLLPLHFFLLNISNTLLVRLQKVLVDTANKQTATFEIRDYFDKTHELRDLQEAENEMHRLQKMVEEHKEGIAEFKLASQYSNLEGDLNRLTGELKDIQLTIAVNAKRIYDYSKSYEARDSVNAAKIAKIYEGVNELLAGNIKKTLDEAIEFRKRISESRRDFLAGEIDKLTSELRANKAKASELEKERSRIFAYLSVRNGIQDLSKAYVGLSRDEGKLREMESQIEIARSLENSIEKLKAEKAQIGVDMTSLLSASEPQISQLREIFFEIHDALYPENSKRAGVGFSISKKPRKDSQISIEISLPKELAKGKNRAKTLLYDLTVLFYRISQKLNGPHFLVHDGIFDGIDKTQFVNLYTFLENKAKELDFQYIVTLNEEGDLSEKFGNADKVSIERLTEEAIVVLDADRPLFGKHWD